MTNVTLLAPDGTTRDAELGTPTVQPADRPLLRTRTAFAAAHVVPHRWADNTPGRPAQIDWDATLGIRRRIMRHGLGVADAMDTAQRNMGLDPAATRELIARSAQLAREEDGALVVGVTTDHVEEASVPIPRIVDAYRQQLHAAEDDGAGVVLMASRHLARSATGADDYRRVYDEVLRAAQAPVVLHWLGTAFDPELAGYFGSDDWRASSEVLLEIVEANADVVSGIKMSLLDADAEIAVRRRLPEGVWMLTGDDYHYVDLIAGDEHGHSDALLGAFATVAPLASAAIQALDRGDLDEYRRILGPTEALSRQVFAAPTPFYKTGVAFLAWLNGHQPAFQMVGGLHSARSLPHLSGLVELANAANALEDPDLARARWHATLQLHGVDA